MPCDRRKRPCANAQYRACPPKIFLHQIGLVLATGANIHCVSESSEKKDLPTSCAHVLQDPWQRRCPDSINLYLAEYPADCLQCLVGTGEGSTKGDTIENAGQSSGSSESTQVTSETQLDDRRQSGSRPVRPVAPSRLRYIIVSDRDTIVADPRGDTTVPGSSAVDHLLDPHDAWCLQWYNILQTNGVRQDVADKLREHLRKVDVDIVSRDTLHDKVADAVMRECFELYGCSL